jgi:hypothetical protein
MKNIFKYSVAALGAGAAMLAAGSCTGNFEKIHDGYFGVTDNDLIPDGHIVGVGFEGISKNVFYGTAGWDYQTYQNLNADVFSGYMATATAYEGNNNNTTYSMMSGWNNACWSNGYSVMSGWQTNFENCMFYGFPGKTFASKEEAMKEDWRESVFKNFIAVNNVLKVLGMSRMVDQYGPIIYSSYGKTVLGSVPYDSAQDVYKSFFVELTDAVEILDWAAQNPSSDFSKFDIIYQGDMKKWARLANTLRLRLAMRMVKYDAAEAKKQAEAAIAAPQGTMVKGDTYTLVGHNWANSLYVISVGYEGDILVSANVESILGGYNDPRLPLYALPTKADPEKITGLRTGLPDMANEKGNMKSQYTPVISHLNIPTPTFRSIAVFGSEAYFLKAEAALRGWNVGGATAKDLYEQGIDASFAEWGLGAPGAYLASTDKPQGYVDPLYAAHNSPAMTDVTPNWDDAATDEQRLEKIITQKWIAMFPEGMNAWAEYRRTGYPRQFPILDNRSQGTITTEEGPRRLPFHSEQVTTNPAGYQDAVTKLGGPDTGATRIFWDVKEKGNF